MQIATDRFEKGDYRHIFGFNMYYPLPISNDYPISKAVDDLYHQGLVPLLIITDKKNDYFQMIKAQMPIEFFNNTKAIILPISFTKLFMS